MDIFLAVIIVILLMNSFLFLVFKRIAVNVGKHAQNYVVRQLSAYDDLIKKKAQKLHELNEAINNEQAQMAKEPVQVTESVPKPINPFAFLPGNYLDTSFLGNYRKVREFFHFDHRLCIKNVLELYDTEQEDIKSLLSRQILVRFSLENRFGIATMEEQDQLAVFKEMLNNEEQSLLEEYCASHPSFDCISFFDWLEVVSFRSNPEVVIRTGESKENLTWLNDRIRMEYDSSICEGIQVVLWNKLYDFSIQKRELCG